MPQTSVKNRWVISNTNRDQFYRRGNPYSNLERAEKFFTKDEAEFWRSHHMTKQESLSFTEVLPVKITIEVLG